MTFRLNSHRDPKEGSPLEKFFGRGVRTYLPALNYRRVDHQALIAERKRKQEKIAAKMGRRSVEHFEIGDPVRIQCPQSGRWTIKATIKTPRVSENGSINSWILTKEDGNETIRNNRYIRCAPAEKTRAVFFDDEERPGEQSEFDSEESEGENHESVPEQTNQPESAENNEESAENEMPESGTQAADKQSESDEGQGGPRHGHYTRRAAQGLEARMRWL